MDQVTSRAPGKYRLDNLKGSKLVLPVHPEACGHESLAEYAKEYQDTPLAVDLFSGAGGLSLGLQRAGFRLALAVDKVQSAVETHQAYFPGASLNQDISQESTLDEILEPLRGRRIALLAGGPPCQPFSKAVRWKRSVIQTGHGSLRDHRRELWQSFLYAAELLKPDAVLMENVPDIASNEDGIVLRSILSRLEELGYTSDCRAFFAYDFGVAQYRQRIFVLAFRDARIPFQWPTPLPKKQRRTLSDAISDLPPLVGGWNEECPPYEGPKTQLQQELRAGMPEEHKFALYDHVTRAVREDDLLAFQLMSSKMRYDELPEELRRYGADSFTDKYNRLAWDEPSRTITAHIAKDGYWYIHPDQHRSLSIREAARIQSFPDWFRFSGHKTSALRQIGEAVAPFVAEALGRQILAFLNQNSSTQDNSSSSSKLGASRAAIRDALEDAFNDDFKRNSLFAWRMEPSLWLNILGETIFSERRLRNKAPLFWKNYRDDWPTPKSFLEDEFRLSHLRTIGMESCIARLEAIAAHLESTRFPSLKSLVDLGVSEKFARRAMAFAGLVHDRPNDAALVRVANRVFGQKQDQSHIDGQIATAMLVGEDAGAVVYSAAIELGEAICTPKDPACMLCPLKNLCSYRMISLAA